MAKIIKYENKGFVLLACIVMSVAKSCLSSGECDFAVTVLPSDFSRFDSLKDGFYFDQDCHVDELVVSVVPDMQIGSHWVDFVWIYGERRGRVSVYRPFQLKVATYASDVPGTRLKLFFYEGYGTVTDVKLNITLDSPCRTVACNSGREPQRILTNYRTESFRGRYKRKTRDPPEWTGFHENDAADWIWVWPITSQYGIQTLALAAGVTVGENHEYVQLAAHEKLTNSLFVPGISIAGPTYPVDSAVGGEYHQGRTMFKYSKRDAAWVLWNFEGNQPIWNGDHGPSYWKLRTSGLPATMQGLVFNLRSD